MRTSMMALIASAVLLCAPISQAKDSQPAFSIAVLVDMLMGGQGTGEPVKGGQGTGEPIKGTDGTGGQTTRGGQGTG